MNCNKLDSRANNGHSKRVEKEKSTFSASLHYAKIVIFRFLTCSATFQIIPSKTEDIPNKIVLILLNIAD